MCHLLLNMHIKAFSDVAEVALDQAEVVCLKQLLPHVQHVTLVYTCPLATEKIQCFCEVTTAAI